MSLQGFFIPGPYDDGDAITGHYYEMASADPMRAQVWGYTDALSYGAGDEVALHLMATAEVRVVVARDGLVPEVVLDRLVAAEICDTPSDCSVT